MVTPSEDPLKAPNLLQTLLNSLDEPTTSVSVHSPSSFRSDDDLSLPTS